MLIVFNLFLLIFMHSIADETAVSQKPNTLLWEVTKPGLSKPSYLLGINHVMSAEWLYNYPEIKGAINSSELLMTEFYGENDNAIFKNNMDIDIRKRSVVKLKAVDLLTKEQYKSVDSFFVARVGEGLTNNPDAEEMNVWEFSSAILMTLLSDKSKQGVSLPCMDRELFEIFKNDQKKSIALDHIENIEFGVKDKEKAKEILNKFVEASKLGDYPGWNLSDTTYTAGKFIHDYKMMAFDYKLSEEDPEKVSLISSHTARDRNYSWLPILKTAFSKNSCLVAVGATHLWYKTGLISLLRKNGYTINPVAIKRVD